MWSGSKKRELVTPSFVGSSLDGEGFDLFYDS
ncbi:hypothetical protein CALK_1099 [Chitinivibrio alkaliphilus ACht1]|uniref:Uncharacterized protein n=1 Tax=Chitinivibrio alkaliphilus ACht1 TaxID=1313304 RepID=U7D5V9_9BACT|nr:hypothetical protein CALK_1099 [Chitinivibrio alkaliphilus ACht1]